MSVTNQIVPKCKGIIEVLTNCTKNGEPKKAHLVFRTKAGHKILVKLTQGFQMERRSFSSVLSLTGFSLHKIQQIVISLTIPCVSI